MKAFLESIGYWKMATLRCLIYALIVYATTFLSMTETYTGDEWRLLSWFETIRIHVSCWVAAGTTVVAFLDQTMARLTKDTSPTETKL